MRMIVVGVVSILATCEAWAAESLALERHTVACQSDQDLIALNINGQSVLQKLFPSAQLWLKYANGTCREYGAGTSVSVEKETSSQGLSFECIKTQNEARCFWAFKEAK